MPENDDNFGENPFRMLDPTRFPGCREVHSPGKRSSGHNHKLTSALLEVSEEEKKLFLSAVAHLPQASQKSEAGGFLLSEQCAWPEKIKEMKKKKAKPQTGTPQPKQPKNAEAGDAEAFLWAMRDALPLSGGGRKVPKTREIVPMKQVREAGMEDFMAGRLEFALSFTDEYLSGHVVGLDELTIGRLAMGQLSPEAHLDLHGLNASQAFEAMRAFFRNCWFKGLRVVLIVTGRGHNSPEGHGVLRQKLQSWLTQEPFKRIVLAFCTAQPYDGGAGAIYVLFRKYRKKGRIYWERMPADADLY